MTLQQIEKTLDELARRGVSEFVEMPVANPTEIVDWIMEKYAEDAIRCGLTAVRPALRAKCNALLKKHSDVDDETGQFQQVDLSSIYPNFPKQNPARVSIKGRDGTCVYKRPDHCTELELIEHVAKQKRLTQGIQHEVREVEATIKWRRSKKVPPEMTTAEWKDSWDAGMAAAAAVKGRRKGPPSSSSPAPTPSSAATRSPGASPSAASWRCSRRCGSRRSRTRRTKTTNEFSAAE